MHGMIRFQRAARQPLLITAWLAVVACAQAEPAAPGKAHAPVSFQPISHPLAWHRDHWHQRSRFDPEFNIEIPWVLFDPYFRWEHAPRPEEPARPDAATPRERDPMWRDDVVGTGSGGRIEVHPEGRILRSRPR